MQNNILDNNSKRQCTGCGGCASICPFSAIIIKEDNEGFLRPHVDSNLCVQCGLCKKVCYKFDDEYSTSDSMSYQAYFAINKNKEELYSASSGGVSKELMKACIENGYKVAGVTYDVLEGKVKTVVVNNVCDIDQFKGSKYAQSYTVSAFKEICKKIKVEKYVIFGTPCQIYVLSKIANLLNARDNMLLIDCFCHGCPSNLLLRKYVNETVLNRKIGDLMDIKFRSKKYGWHNFAFDFIGTKTTYSSPKVNDPFFDLFFGLDLLNDECYNCICRSNIEKCDMRIGDFWGKRFADDRMGVSCIVINSKRGERFFDQIKSNITYGAVDFKELIKAQSYNKKHSYNNERRKYLLGALQSEAIQLKKIHKKYFKMFSLKQRVKRKLKNAIKFGPPKLVSKLRKMFSD